jgi:Tfp pilus assembly protein PilO
MRVRVDRLWIIGGALGAVLLLAIAWFFLISPRNGEIAALRDQAQAAHGRLTPLTDRLAQLRAENTELPRYQAELKRDREALPTTPETAAFLRSLQAAGEATNVTVGGLNVGAPTQVTAAGATMLALPVTVTAGGGADGIDKFLNELQRVHPRAVLVNRLAMTSSDPKAVGVYNITLTTQVFVSPPSGAAKASPTPKTK